MMRMLYPNHIIVLGTVVSRMNVDIQFDGTELSKSAKYALIISDLI